MATARAKFEITAEDKTRQAFNSVKASMGAVINTAAKLGASVGAATVALTAAAKQAFTAAEAINVTSRNLGLSAQMWQKYSIAADMSGVAQSQLSGGLSILIKRIGELRTTGTGPLIASLGKYNAELLNGLRNSASQAEAISLVSEALQNETDATKRAALANAAFGRSGVVMADFVRNIDAAGAAAAATGAILSNDVIARADELDDQFDVLEQKIRADLTRSLVELGPTLIGVSEGFREFFQFVQDGAKALGFFAEKAGVLNTNFAGGNEDDVLARIQVRMERLDELKKALAFASEKGLVGDQRRAIEEMTTLGAEVGKLNDRLNEIRGRNNADAPAGGALGDLVGNAPEVLGDTAKAAEAAAASYAKLIEEMSRGNEVLRMEAEGHADLIPLYQAKMKASDILGRSLLPAEIAQIEQLVASESALNNTLTDQKNARDAVAKAAENQKRAAEKLLQQQRRDAERQQKQVRADARKAAEEAQEPFKRAAENIQRSFGDLFTDVFRNGLDGWRGFADAIKEIFFRLAGEVAALLIFRPQALGVLLGIGGGVASTAANAAGGAGNILGSLGSAGSGFGGAAKLLSLLRDPTGAIANGLLSLAELTGSQTLLNLSTTAATNAGSGLLTGGAGILGGFAANAVFGGGAGTNIGATIGGGIGSIWGPLGAGVGSFLGGAIGSLFGGGKKASPKAFFSSQNETGPEGIVGLDKQGNPRARAINSPLGRLIFSTQHADVPESAQAAIDALAQFDQVISASISESARVAARVAQGKFQSGGKGGVDVATAGLQRLGLIGGGIGSSSNTFDQAVSQAIAKNTSFSDIQGSFTKIGETVSKIGLVRQIVEAGDGSVQFANSLKLINENFDDLLQTARDLNVPLEKINAARQREIDALREQAGFGPIQNLFKQLTSTSSAFLPFETVLGQARGRFESARTGAMGGDPAGIAALPDAASAYLDLLRGGFGSGPEFARGNAEVIMALSDVIAGGADQASLDSAGQTDVLIAANSKLDVQTATLEQINRALNQLLTGGTSGITRTNVTAGA